MKRRRTKLYAIPAALLALLLGDSLIRAALILIPRQRERDAFAELKQSALEAPSPAPAAPAPEGSEAPPPDESPADAARTGLLSARPKWPLSNAKTKAVIANQSADGVTCKDCSD